MKKLLVIFLTLMLALCASSCKKEEESSLISPSSQSQEQSKSDAKDNKDTNNNDKSSKAPKTEKRNLLLYFTDSAAQYLRCEERNLSSDDDAVEWAIVYELIKGPKSENLSPSVQGEVGILSIETKKGLCTIDLTKEFVEANTGGSAKENIAIYALVNSLCELQTIDKVKINIEGNTQAEFGEMLLDTPLEPNNDLVDKT